MKGKAEMTSELFKRHKEIYAFMSEITDQNVPRNVSILI